MLGDKRVSDTGSMQIRWSQETTHQELSRICRQFLFLGYPPALWKLISSYTNRGSKHVFL